MAGGQVSSSTDVASVFFGTFLGLFVFSAAKAARQTASIWERTRSIWNWYLWMIWIEVVCNFAFSLATYLLLRGIIKPRYAILGANRRFCQIKTDAGFL